MQLWNVMRAAMPRIHCSPRSCIARPGLRGFLAIHIHTIFHPKIQISAWVLLLFWDDTNTHQTHDETKGQHIWDQHQHQNQQKQTEWAERWGCRTINNKMYSLLSYFYCLWISCVTGGVRYPPNMQTWCHNHSAERRAYGFYTQRQRRTFL